jgi:hypothetical protein
MSSLAIANRLARREKKLCDQCALLAKVILSLQPIHSSSSTTTDQLQLLETMIGAVIWYLPQFSVHWTGRASVSAVQLLEAGEQKKVSKDHETPRKLAARQILSLPSEQVTAGNIRKLYLENFGRFNLVTRAENRKLMQFQRAHVFVSPEQSYAEAGIVLVDASNLQSAKKRVGVLKSSSLVETNRAEIGKAQDLISATGEFN